MMNSGTDVLLPVSQEALGAYQATADDFRILNAFLPSVLQRRLKAFNEKQRFVHYTSSDAAMNIVRSEHVWLRNVACMNDFSEVEHGIQRVIEYFRSEHARPFWDTLDSFEGGMADKVKALYDSWRSDFRHNTYIFCMSEHDASEDETGRLSMWRAYGKATGLAFVGHGTAFHAVTDALGTFSNPVEYGDNQECIQLFNNVVHGVTTEREFLGTLDRQLLIGQAFQMLQYFSLCLKHPAFREEREWRLIHRPRQNASERMKKRLEVIAGVPQLVYALPLKDLPDEGIRGASLPALVERVLIGPTAFPLVVYEAIVELLKEAQVPDPERKAVLTWVPLRT